MRWYRHIFSVPYKLKPENRPTSFRDSYRTSRVLCTVSTLHTLCTHVYAFVILCRYMAELLLWRNKNARMYAVLLPIIYEHREFSSVWFFLFFYYYYFYYTDTLWLCGVFQLGILSIIYSSIKHKTKEISIVISKNL